MDARGTSGRIWADLFQFFPVTNGLHFQPSLFYKPVVEYMHTKYTRKVPKSFSWTRTSCNTDYFKSLRSMLNHVRIQSNTSSYTRRITKRASREKYCNKLSCSIDAFHSGKKYFQLILGRFAVTGTCYANCKHYFTLDITNWSLFKNDILIQHFMKDDFFYKQYTSLELDPIIPIRIALTDIHTIPKHIFKQHSDDFVRNYTYNIRGKKTMSARMLKILHIKYPHLMNAVSETIISRELCMLHALGMNFYIAKYTDKNSYEPYIFVTKKSLQFLENAFPSYIHFEHI